MARNMSIYSFCKANGERTIGKIKWSISRGRDTYGYNICSLWVRGRKVATCNGGGYDMVGTVLGDYLEQEAQEELKKLTPAYIYDEDAKESKCLRDQDNGHLYGLTHYVKGGVVVRASIDGACGRETVRQIAEACGWTITQLD